MDGPRRVVSLQVNTIFLGGRGAPAKLNATTLELNVRFSPNIKIWSATKSENFVRIAQGIHPCAALISKFSFAPMGKKCTRRIGRPLHAKLPVWDDKSQKSSK